MIFKLTKAAGRGRAVFMKPKHLPCGCEVIGHAQVVGLDGLPVQGIAGLNTRTGWLWLRRIVVEPDLVKMVEGKLATSAKGMELVHVTAPFLLRCVNHGWLDEPEAHEGHGRRDRDLCSCGVTDRAECCAAYGCFRCAEVLYRRAAAEQASQP